jgi:hypothetical protein
VLGSIPLTFVTPTPFTVILDKYISMSNELLVICIVTEDGGVSVGVAVGVLVGVGDRGVFVGVLVGVLVAVF